MKEAVHLGENIRRILDIKGIKQEAFAEKMGVSQAAISKLLSTPKIDDERLKEVADKLGTSVDAIKRFDAERIMFHIETMNDNSGNFNVYEIHPIDKVSELYEKMLKEKNDEIEKLKQQLSKK
jgi:transcriptional regulator with XRE-family HTH domain